MRRPPCRLSLLAVFLTGSFAGCGWPQQTDFPNALTNADGQPILFDDVREILSDDDLTDDQKRQALRDLGIEDERLIEALVEA